jgi:hypothetical protein
MSQKTTTLIAGLAAVGLAAGAGTLALAQQQTPTGGDIIGELSSNEGIFVDAKTFKIAKGKAKGDPAAQIAKMGAKEVGPGAIIFRSGDKLYMVEGTPTPAPQAMKDFQSNWNVSYMKALKDFQDGWNISYMKDFQSNWNVSYMKDPGGAGQGSEAYMKALKDFQDNWNVSYMKGLKEFQDNWNTSYMKNAQDNWNISYMKSVKDFQDNWSTSYMK